jgi:hypothetical protein
VPLLRSLRLRDGSAVYCDNWFLLSTLWFRRRRAFLRVQPQGVLAATDLRWRPIASQMEGNYRRRLVSSTAPDACAGRHRLDFPDGPSRRWTSRPHSQTREDAGLVPFRVIRTACPGTDAKDPQRVQGFQTLHLVRRQRADARLRDGDERVRTKHIPHRPERRHALLEVVETQFPALAPLHGD